MKFQSTTLNGAVLIELEKHGDKRGFFARTFCRQEFTAQGLHNDFTQHNTSYSAEAGTLRGLHYQLPPNAEIKVIRAVHGAIRDVIVDLRPGSETFGRWDSFDLSAEDGTALYIPQGFAHGFQTLKAHTTVVYLASHPFTPEAERGIRWDDPTIAIDWARPVTTISEKDTSWPDVDLTAIACQ